MKVLLLVAALALTATSAHALKGLNGADFDREYDSMQLARHKDAASLFERYAKGGENGNLKAFAAKHLPHLQEHLRLAKT